MSSQNKNNQLYPVFFRLDKLKMLIVGAGEVGEEKLHFILKSSPNANITIVAPWAKPEVEELIKKFPHSINWIRRKVEQGDIAKNDLIISATNFPAINKQVHTWAKMLGKIVNVADTPSLCDFYMGSIVTRGDLKVAISTNGKSPTFAKRFRQLLESILPNSTERLILNLKTIRDHLKGNFEYKVNELNRITDSLVADTIKE